MLALVKKPRIEISLQGENIDELLNWIKKKYEISVLVDDQKDDYISIGSTKYGKNMEKNRVGNLIAGARLKSGLTQAELAEKLDVRQNVISDYERGERRCSKPIAKKLSEVLNVNEEHLEYKA
jgi:DNA-binding XRE family transcriptional regulator